MENLKIIIDNYGTISAAIVVAISLYVKFRGYIRYAIRTITLGNHFHDIFGDAPAQKIQELYSAIKSSNDIGELRQRITERRIKLGIYICDKEGRCIWTNSCLNELFGLDSTEMRESGWLRGIHPDDRERVNDAWLYSIRNNTGYECDYRVINRRTHAETLVRTSAMAALNLSGHVECYVGYLEEVGADGDITRYP